MPARVELTDFAAIRAGHDIRDVAERYTSLPIGRRRNGPCPKCGGHDRFYVQRDRRGVERFHCTHCNPKGGDVIDLIMWADGVDRSNAIRILNGLPIVERQPEVSQLRWRDSQWQASKLKRLALASDLLHRPTPRGFLRLRGLDFALCLRYGLGYDPCAYHSGLQTESPAIVLPYKFSDGSITAIRSRFIHPDISGNDRFRFEPGSEATIFGSDLLTGAPVLVLTEGEFNCIALRQALPDSFDVASFGGDTQTRYVPAVVAKYARTVLWMDDPTKLDRELARCKGHDVRGVVSPTGPNGKKQDANDLLRIAPERLGQIIKDAGGEIV